MKFGSKVGFSDEQRNKAIQSNIKAAKESKANRQAMYVACASKKPGVTLQQIVDKLNKLGLTTPRGKDNAVA